MTTTETVPGRVAALKARQKNDGSYHFFTSDHEETQRGLLGMPMTAACAVCSWSIEGQAEACIAAAREHRAAFHPELKERTEKERRALAKAGRNAQRSYSQWTGGDR